MRLQVCRMVYEDAVGIDPQDVVPLREAAKKLGINQWSLSQLALIDMLTLLIDADAPRGWAWRWLLLRSEVDELAAAGKRR
jgi:hypothetical protein